jgi:hypothetical protein
MGSIAVLTGSALPEGKASTLNRDDQLRHRIQGEADREHFDARRSVQTIYEDVVDPQPWRRDIWIHDGILGYGSSGNIAVVKATSIDDPEIVDIIQRFEALKRAAAAWPETIRWATSGTGSSL